MMMCHPTKFGCKKISSSIDMSETVICIWSFEPSPWPWTWRQQIYFLAGTRVHDGASPYQVWLQKLQRLRRYRWVEHSLECLTVSVTFTLTTTEQSNLFTRQSSSWLGAIKPIYFKLRKDQQFRRHFIKSSLMTWIFHRDLDLEDSKPIFLEDSLAHGDALPHRVW